MIYEEDEEAINVLSMAENGDTQRLKDAILRNMNLLKSKG
jgi:hypothetical protein